MKCAGILLCIFAAVHASSYTTSVEHYFRKFYVCTRTTTHADSWINIGDKSVGLNVMFVVHSSITIPDNDFDLLQQSVIDVVDYLKRGGINNNDQKSYSVGLVTVAETASKVLTLRQGSYHAKNQTFQTRLLNITRSANGTNIKSALTTIFHAFDVSRGNQILSPNLCILLVASPPDDKTAAVAASKTLKDAGISLMVVAVGDGVTKEDYYDIASNKNVVIAVNSNSSTSTNASDSNTTEWPRTPILEALNMSLVLPRYSLCYQSYMHIVIIVDIAEVFEDTLLALKEFAVRFNHKYAHILVMVINSPTWDPSYMNTFRRISDVGGISMKTFGNSFGLDSSLTAAKAYFNEMDKVRNMAENLIIVVTDSGYDTNDIDSPVQEFWEAKIHILCLGVGSEISRERLLHIVTDPDGVYQTDGADGLIGGLDSLNRRICPAACDRGWVYYDGMCYLTAATFKSWLGAKTECNDYNSRLASVTTQDKLNWLLNNPMIGYAHAPAYIGLRKHVLDTAPITSVMRWESGQPLALTYWSFSNTTKEPNGGVHESCVSWSKDGWIDIGCSISSLGIMICETDAGNSILKKQQGVSVRPLFEEKECLFLDEGVLHPGIIIKGKNCRPVYEPFMRKRLSNNIHKCSNGELISRFDLCDGISHCRDGSDEQGCPTTCKESQFRCDNGRCVSLVYLCDVWNDCGDNSDEKGCVYPYCPSTTSWRCESGQCVPLEKECNLIYDCYDRSDEKNCEKCRFKRCYDGTCIPNSWIRDGIVDCGGSWAEDENKFNVDLCYTGKYSELYYLFASKKYSRERTTCTMVFDGHGKSFGTYGQDHDCSDKVWCPIGFYQCPHSYCIPMERVCDGTMNCVNGEEEVGCDNYTCPGYFRCPGTNYCIHPALVCDGEDNCPGGRDEVFCDFSCPVNCTCTNGHVTCINYHHNETTPFDSEIKHLVLAGSSIADDKIFSSLHRALEINLHGSKIDSIGNLFTRQVNLRALNISNTGLLQLQANSFSALAVLSVLDISCNSLHNLSENNFLGLTSLRVLYIKHSELRRLEKGIFSSLGNLRTLDLTGNGIHTIQDGTFVGLNTLLTLKMKGNTILDFQQGVFSELLRVETIHTDVYSLCCPQIRPQTVEDANCLAPQNSISSCSDLMGNDVLRAFIWILSLAALVGNILTITFRLSWERNSMRNGFGVFVTNLSISDFLMGVYLMIIAAADKHYEGRYIWNESKWRGSPYCHVAGFLSTLSSEASTFFICLITLDRFLVIKYPFGQIKFRNKSASAFAALAWTLAIVLAGVPLLPAMHHWNFYTKNGACLALPFASDKKAGWVYSTILFTGINFVAFLLIAVGQYSIYRKIKEASVVSSKQRSAKEMAIARRLLLIVVTDFLCWFPVGIMSILALEGTKISGEAYAWTAVFVLPVNSAINPFLYTIPAVLQKMRSTKADKAGTYNTQTSVSYVMKKRRVARCQFTPDLVLFEQALQQTKSQLEEIQLINEVMTAVSDTCSTTVSEDSTEHNATSHQLEDNGESNVIYIGMRGIVLDRVCIATKKDHQRHALTSYILSRFNNYD